MRPVQVSLQAVSQSSSARFSAYADPNAFGRRNTMASKTTYQHSLVQQLVQSSGSPRWACAQFLEQLDRVTSNGSSKRLLLRARTSSELVSLFSERINELGFGSEPSAGVQPVLPVEATTRTFDAAAITFSGFTSEPDKETSMPPIPTPAEPADKNTVVGPDGKTVSSFRNVLSGDAIRQEVVDQALNITELSEKTEGATEEATAPVAAPHGSRKLRTKVKREGEDFRLDYFAIYGDEDFLTTHSRVYLAYRARQQAKLQRQQEQQRQEQIQQDQQHNAEDGSLPDFDAGVLLQEAFSKPVLATPSMPDKPELAGFEHLEPLNPDVSRDRAVEWLTYWRWQFQLEKHLSSIRRLKAEQEHFKQVMNSSPGPSLVQTAMRSLHKHSRHER